MKKLKFKTDHDPMCLFCKHGKEIPLTDDMTCSKKGIVHKESKCGKYEYDLLKRRPRRRLEMDTSKYSAEDFII